MEGPCNGDAAYELPRNCNFLWTVQQKVLRQSLPDAATAAQQREEARMEAFQNIKRELSEAPALCKPTEKGMYIFDTGAYLRR